MKDRLRNAGQHVCDFFRGIGDGILWIVILIDEIITEILPPHS